MPTYSQRGRLMTISTSLDEDALLIQELVGQEAISALFHFRLDLLAENITEIPFDKLLGQKVTVLLELPDAIDVRYFSGIASRIVRGTRGQEFTNYQLEIVPELWLLTKKFQSRIFQKMSVPDILQEVLRGLNVKYNLQGSYEPRVYCVQYRETDFNFASRLMEEEGIFYFFTHSEDGHEMVVSDHFGAYPDVPCESKIIYESIQGQYRDEDRILSFSKTQEIRSGQVTLFDHSFELPHKHLDVNETMIDGTIAVGDVKHILKVGPTAQLEIYDYPGGYAKRFDGTPGKILADGERTADIRMQSEECNAVVMEGEGTCRQFTSGHKFELERHFSDNGEYVLTGVSHSCRQDLQFRSHGEQSGDTIDYTNQFRCIPRAVPFRPLRTAVRPVVHGTQTAVVTGPAGEEIHTDKYGRIKVQFHWDRAGSGDEQSSCWVRVATPWAGKGWGMFTLPRVGQEVVVDFLEGDPDRPLVVGSVYNADHMHAYDLPAEQTKSYLKSLSSKGGKGFNEIRFEDKKSSEQVFLHGEKDLEIRIKNDRKEWIGRDRHLMVKRDKFEHIERDSHADIKRDYIEKIGRDHHIEVAGKEAIKVTGSHSMKVQGDVIEEFKANHSCQVTQNVYLKGMQVVIEASAGITLKVGGNFVTIDPSGVAIKGTLIQLNSAGMALTGTAGALVAPLSPTAALEAVKADPGAMGAAVARRTMTPAALSLQQVAPAVRRSAAADAPTHAPDSEENLEKKSWIEIELVDEAGQPVPGEPYRITLPDGTTVADGTTDEKGRARVDHIDPGSCKVTFPNLDKDAWQPK